MDEEPESYEDILEDLEQEVKHAESDFQEAKDEEATGSLKEKQERAENLMNEIHDQLEFLENHLDEIESKD